MRFSRALRALVRVELRQLRRHRGRSLLMLLLVAVPVAALVGGSALVQITEPTPEERRAQILGSARLRVELRGETRLAAVAEHLPSSARTVPMLSGGEWVRIPGRRLGAKSISLPPGALEPGGLAVGVLQLQEGFAPESATEVALSRILLSGLGRSLGQSVTLRAGPNAPDDADAPGGKGTQMRITGVVQDPEDASMPLVLRALADAPAPERGARSLLVALPESEVAATAERLRGKGYEVSSRAEIGAPDPFLAVVLFVIGGFGFFEAALVIAAAFAVSLRRRQREIGLLGSCGASAGGMRTSLFVSAVVLASCGGLLGVLVGTGAAAVLHPHLDDWNGRLNGAFEVSWIHVAGAMLLGVLTAAAAVALPARSATGLPIRVALSGRRPLTSGSGAWLVVGLVLLTAGLGGILFGPQLGDDALAGVTILGGSVLAVLGFGAVSPWLLDRLARLAGPLPLAWRLAVRDAGRFRARNGPVVTAVLAGMSVSVLLAGLFTSVDRLMSAGPAVLRDDQLLVEGPGAEEVAHELGTRLPSVARAPLEAVYAQGRLVRALSEESPAESQSAHDGWVACGGEELLLALAADEGSEGLRAGRLLALTAPTALGKPQTGSGSVHIVPAGKKELRGLGERIETVALSQDVAGPSFVLGRDELEGLGLDAGPPPGGSLVPWLVRLEQPIDEELLERARSVASVSAGTTVDAGLLHERPTRSFLDVVLAICVFTGLVVIFIATALSSVESTADARVLHTVGAAPSLLRGHLAARAGYLAFLGCVLAVPAGLIPLVGLLRLANLSLDFALPWPDVLATVFGLPAIAFGGTWLFALVRNRSAKPGSATA